MEPVSVEVLPPRSSPENETDGNGSLTNAPPISLVPFAVALPSEAIQGLDEPQPKGESVMLVGDNGIVGSIVFLKKSITVWVGWGSLNLTSRGSVGGHGVDQTGDFIGSGTFGARQSVDAFVNPYRSCPCYFILCI